MADSALSRRSFFRNAAAAVAASTAALATTAVEASTPDTDGRLFADDRQDFGVRPIGYVRQDVDTVERLIQKHQKAWLRFDRSCPLADECDPRYAGPAAEDRAARYGRSQERALIALLQHAPETEAGRARKATYLLTTIGAGGRWQPNTENVCALLQSLL